MPVGPQRTVSVQPTTGSVSATFFFSFLGWEQYPELCMRRSEVINRKGAVPSLFFFFSFGNVDSNKSKHFVSCLRVFGGN